MKTALRDGGIASPSRALARVLLLVIAVGSLALACTDEDGTAGCSDAAVDFLLPTQSLTDWVSYADQLSVVEVVAEERLWPPPPTSGAPPDEYVGRRVDIRVSKTPWRRPTAPIAPARLSFVTDGWSIRSGLRPVTIGEGPRLEIGHRYLMALVRLDEGDWDPYSGTTLPLDPDGTLGTTCSQRPTLKALRGKTVEEAGQLLADTPPDPRTVPHAHLPVRQRIQAAYATTAGPD